MNKICFRATVQVLERCKKHIMSLKVLVLSGILLFQAFNCMSADDIKNDDNLLDKYIKSKNTNLIVFDSSNIKQFWIDKSVISRNDTIEILLNRGQTFESVPLGIQLANVDETIDCKVEVISKTEDFAFSVLDNNLKVISSSTKEDNFLNYSITSALFHLEDTRLLSFSLKFSSNTADALLINKIILSFSENKTSSFLGSPGKITFSSKEVNTSSKIVEGDSNAFSVTGKQTMVYSNKKILIKDNTLVSSVTIKNTGDTAVDVRFGYAIFNNKDPVRLDGRNYPYKKINKVLNVVSSAAGSNKIVVDGYSDWTKDCFLAINAKEDMSDIPNNAFVGTGHIDEIKKLENGQAEITMDRPLGVQIKEGTKVRIHGGSGALLYTYSIVLQPGQEEVFSSATAKDETLLEFSSKAFSRGIYYVIPIIRASSIDATKDHTLLIRDYEITY